MATTTRTLNGNVSGAVYTNNLNSALEALDTCHSGSTAPTDEVSEGKLWLDTSTTPATLKVFNNSSWTSVVNATSLESLGALMDSELTSAADVKALDQGVSTADSPTFDGLTTTGDLVGFSGRLINASVSSSAGTSTFTPQDETSFMLVELVGGGGGGGGADGDTPETDIGCGGGGGAGGHSRVWLSKDAATYTIVIGAGGAGGSHSSTKGSDGADSTFTSDGNTTISVTTSGGEGGDTRSDSNTHVARGGDGGGSSITGSSRGFYANSYGGPGQAGLGVPSDELAGDGFSIGGSGGSSAISGGALGTSQTGEGNSSEGNAGRNRGAGGSGASALGSATAKSGGNGAAGMIFIYEYSE